MYKLLFLNGMRLKNQNSSEKCQKICSNLKSFLLKECQKFDKQNNVNSNDCFKKLTDLFNDKKISYIINERFLNIPPAISIPMYESLLKDLNEKKIDFDFVFFS